MELENIINIKKSSYRPIGKTLKWAKYNMNNKCKYAILNIKTALLFNILPIRLPKMLKGDNTQY